MSSKNKFTKIPLKTHLLLVLGISLLIILMVVNSESPPGDAGSLLTLFLVVPVFIPAIFISTSLTRELFAKMGWLLRYPVIHYVLVYISGIFLGVILAGLFFRLRF